MDLSKYDWNFRLFGTPVRVMATFWLLCVFFSPFGASQKGPWLFGLIGWGAAVFVSFLTHEFGHAYAMRKLYGGTPRIDLGVGRLANGGFVFGGMTTASHNGRQSPRTLALTSASGPLTEILCALAFIVVLSGFGVKFYLGDIFGLPILPVPDPERFAGFGNSTLAYTLFFFTYGYVYVSLVWGVFNLLPIYPWDGGQLMFAFLVDKFGSRGAKLALQISVAAAVLLGLLFLKSGSYFMTFFMFYSAYQNYRLLSYRTY